MVEFATMFPELDKPVVGENGRSKRRPDLSEDEIRFHVAAWKIAKGKGSILQNLAVVASYGSNREFTVDAMKALIKRVEYDYSPDQIEPEDGLDPADIRYLAQRYRSLDDPSVREFLRGINSSGRSRPDWRRSSDRVGAHGKARRVRVGRES
jgi:hypothetical protein